jgi:hypothetical protein
MLHKFLFLAILICGVLASMGQDTTCIPQDLGKIYFKKRSSKLTTQERNKLDTLISLINSRPECVVLTSSYSADLCKKCGALAWDRQNAIIRYLLRKGVDEYRLTSHSHLTGNADFVMLTFSNWTLINRLALHPGLKPTN